MPNLIKKSHTASLDIDCQKTFTPLCPNELPIAHGDTIVPALNSQARFAKCRIGSKDAHPPNAFWLTKNPKEIGTPCEGHKHIDAKWPSHAILGSQGFELLDGLPDILEYDFFVYKGLEKHLHPYGACYHDLTEQLSTGLIEFLHQHHIQTTLLGGLALDFCVKATAHQLQQAGFQVIIHGAATYPVGSREDTLKGFQEAGIVYIETLQELEMIDD